MTIVGGKLVTMQEAEAIREKENEIMILQNI